MKSFVSISFVRALAVGLLLPAVSVVAFAGGGSAVSIGSASEIIARKTSSLGPISLPGVSISNFGVVDGHIFRGEQPSGKDYSALKAIGVQTIIDLREDSKSSARRDAE